MRNRRRKVVDPLKGKIMNFLKLALPAVALSLSGVAGAHAEDFQPKAAGTWMVNLRATDVITDEDAKIKTAAGVDTGFKADVSDSVMPTLGITYFFTDNIAAEVILGTTRHSVKVNGLAGEPKFYKTWVLPPVVSLQYHFSPKSRVSPYVGAGVNYMLFYGGDDTTGFDTKLDDGFGLALQGGVDVALQGKYSLNVDVKKVFFETDAKVSSPLGALKSKVDLDPWVVSLGVGYKF